MHLLKIQRNIGVRRTTGSTPGRCNELVLPIRRVENRRIRVRAVGVTALHVDRSSRHVGLRADERGHVERCVAGEVVVCRARAHGRRGQRCAFEAGALHARRHNRHHDVLSCRAAGVWRCAGDGIEAGELGLMENWRGRREGFRRTGGADAAGEVAVVTAVCVALALRVGFRHASVHVWPMLLRSPALLLCPDGTREPSWTHTALTMASEGVHASECASAETNIVLYPHVDLGVPLEIVLADEALLADVAHELPVTEMSLDVCADVLAAAEPRMATAWMKALPFVRHRVLLADVG